MDRLGPLVSVVIPFYSKSKGILISSVKSALEQSYEHLEVIVVDDNSPISAENELCNITDDRLFIKKNKDNMNGALSRNIGVEAARGELIAFLDFDDFWYPEKVQKQVETIASDDFSSICYCQAKVTGGIREFVIPKRAISKGELISDYIFVARNPIQTSGIMLHRRIAKENPFHDLPRHQDYQFCLSLEEAGYQFRMVGEPLYEFRQIFKKNDYEYSEWWLGIYGKYFSVKARGAFKKDVIVRSLIIHHHRYLEAFSYCYKEGAMSAFFEVALRNLAKNILRKMR